MSYFTSLYKTAIDSLVKGYVDAVVASKQQQKIVPEDLVLSSIADFFGGAGKFDASLFSFHKPIVSNIPLIDSENPDITSESYYDPIRQALGASYSYDGQSYGFGKQIKEIVYPKNKMEAMEGYDANKDYSVLASSEGTINPDFEEYYQSIGSSTVLNNLLNIKSFDSNFQPNVLYKLHPRYFNSGIQFIEFKNPVALNGSFNGFVDNVFNIGYKQKFAVHFDYSVYTFDSSIAKKASSVDGEVDLISLKKSLPLTLLYPTSYKNKTLELSQIKTMDFLFTFGESVSVQPQTKNNWDGVYIDRDKSFYTVPNPENPSTFIEDSTGKLVGGYLQTAWHSNLGGKIYQDYSFNARSAISEEVIGFYGEELKQNNPVADIKPVYNFVSPYWEKNMPNSEHMILNIYTYALGKNNLGDVERKKVNFENYGYKIKNCNIQEQEELIENSYKYSNIVFLDSLQKMNEKAETAKSQFPMYNEVSFYGEKSGDISSLLNETGMLVDILKSVMSYETTNYALYKQDSTSQDAEDFASYMSSRQEEFILRSIVSTEKLNQIRQMKYPTIFSTSNNSFGAASPSDFVLDTKDFKAPMFVNNFLLWLQYYINESLEDSGSGFSLYHPFYTYNQMSTFYHNDSTNLNQVDSKAIKMVRLLQFLPKFKEIILKKMKHIHDLYSAGNIQNDLSYSETIYYEIIKSEVFPKGAASINQKIYIPVSDYSDYIKYIDTQVKYGTRYRYEINEVKMVIGTEYRYVTAPGYFNNDNLNVYREEAKTYKNPYTNSPYYGDDGSLFKIGSNITNVFIPTFYEDRKIPGTGTEIDLANYHLMLMEVEYRPTVRIVKNELYSENDVIIVDNPPLPPLTNIYPMSGQKNKILLTLENQTGDRDMVPVPIDSADTSFFQLVRNYQKRNLTLPDGKLYNPTLRFKSDDAALTYQVYRLMSKPKSYSDFTGGVLYSLDAATQTSLEDNIVTNQKYYYTFRTIDRHQNISNPSPIYEVEMVEDSEVVYPIIKIMDEFSEDKKYMFSKRFRRYLMIDAADNQIGINKEKSEITGETAATGKPPVLGTAAKSLWNDKRFKFRIKSRESGKVIDLNLAFKTKHIQSEQEKTNLCD